jgi:hypothetical protein
MATLVSYHTSRAVGKADMNGGWSQRPRAWRFVVLRFTFGETLPFTPEQTEMVAQDHVNCLNRLRSCDVDEELLMDRVGGQRALSKFMIEATARPGSTPTRRGTCSPHWGIESVAPSTERSAHDS